MNSFRLKVALLSGLITGLLLIVSSLVLWRISYSFNLDRLDHEILNLGQGNLDRIQGGEHWVRLEEALKFVSPGRAPAAYVLWVKNYDKVVYQSPDWPAQVAPETFVLPETYAGKNPPRPGEPLPPPPRRGEQISARNPALPLKSPQFFTRPTPERSWRIGVMGNPYVSLILAANMDEFDSRMAGLRNTCLAAALLGLLLVPGGAWLVSRRALRPVTALTQTAERITARGLGQRIPAMAGDREFDRLVTVFNEMMDRLEKSFGQATRFSADASHELKTPLARLQAELEHALQQAPAGSPQQEVYSSLLDEVRRLKAIVEKLLLLSVADAGRLQLHRKRVDLTGMLENIIEDCRAQAPHLSVEAILEPGALAEADPDLLEEALQNLVGNAIKYNRDGGRIHFELAKAANRVIVRITNTGPGIAAADRDRIFERFYRGDRSHSARVEGIGLGLSLAREIIRAHGGDLDLTRSDGESTCFTAELASVSGQPVPCPEPAR